MIIVTGAVEGKEDPHLRVWFRLLSRFRVDHLFTVYNEMRILAIPKHKDFRIPAKNIAGGPQTLTNQNAAF